MIGLKNGRTLGRDHSLIATLKRVDGMIDGWGKHYWFCNDGQVLRSLDDQIGECVRGFLGNYRVVREDVAVSKRNALLGLSELAQIKREPFAYPSLKT